jgi:aspartokinase/homoserine dehydrogenase 1
MVWDREGIPTEEAIDRLDDARPIDLESIVEHIEAAPLERLIVVDATASDDIARYYPRLLKAGASVVTPNKRANSLEMAYFRELHSLARNRGVAYRYETTVGAGLPILSTIRDLVLSGDRIHRVEGVLSGTLAFVCSRLGEGVSFAQALGEAHLRGFTEPDPREDLAGRDVARKILIVAREMGLSSEPEEVQVESLLEEADMQEDVDTFMARLDDLNEAWERRVAEARDAGGVLRYIATASPNELRVGLRICLPDSPFAGVHGTDNMVAITSDRYPADSPLVIRGAGAGPEVTAAGIMADLIRAAQMDV